MSNLVDSLVEGATLRRQQKVDSCCCIQRALRCRQARSEYQGLREARQCKHAACTLSGCVRRCMLSRRLYHLRVSLPAFFKRKRFIRASSADDRAGLRAAMTRITQRWWMGNLQGVTRETLSAARASVARILAAARRRLPRSLHADTVAGLLAVEEAVAREALERELRRLKFRWGGEQRAADLLSWRALQALARVDLVGRFSAAVVLVPSRICRIIPLCCMLKRWHLSVCSDSVACALKRTMAAPHLARWGRRGSKTGELGREKGKLREFSS
jgi:hypothetical protein